MPAHKINPEKAQKTAVLVGLLNLALSPLYLFDTRLGLATSLGMTTALLYKLNTIGMQRRPGANLENKLNNFFGPITGDKNTDVLNTICNVINGGDAVFDSIVSSLFGAKK